MDHALAAFTLLGLGFHRTPWWLIGGVLAAALISRGAVFLWVMFRKNS